MAENQIQAPPPPLAEGQINGGGSVAVTSSENVASKRQRRPSVRLGDIGDQSYDRRTINNASSKSSKTRPLTNLTPSPDLHQTLDSHSKIDNLAIGSWNLKDPKRRGGSTKRVRSNWVPKIDEGGGEEQGEGEGDDKYSGGEDLDDFEQSPIHSMENEREVVYRRSIGDRVDASDSDVRDWNGSVGRYGEDGIRIWLNSLGLGRYAPVFEIHEVDDQVLPLLTLEDLKDMGIDAVGSRRKMYCAIQKLGKGFS